MGNDNQSASAPLQLRAVSGKALCQQRTVFPLDEPSLSRPNNEAAKLPIPP